MVGRPSEKSLVGSLLDHVTTMQCFVRCRAAAQHGLPRISAHLGAPEHAHLGAGYTGAALAPLRARK